MIISVTLPNVAFSRPPQSGPAYSATSSVALPISVTVPRIATAAAANSHAGGPSVTCKKITAGRPTASSRASLGRVRRNGRGARGAGSVTGAGGRARRRSGACVTDAAGGVQRGRAGRPRFG